MKSCTHCGTPAQTIKSIRRLRSEVERLTERANEQKESKKNEIAKRRLVEKELEKIKANIAKNNVRQNKVKEELNKIKIESAKLQSLLNSLRKTGRETTARHRRELKQYATSAEKIRKIKQVLKG